MRRVTAIDAITANLVRVGASDRPVDLPGWSENPSITYAVFRHDPSAAAASAFAGFVSGARASASPTSPFARLVDERVPEPLGPDASLEEIAAAVAASPFVAVCDEGRFAGAITAASVIQLLLQEKSALAGKLQFYKNRAREDSRRSTRVSQRNESVSVALRKLMGLLTQPRHANFLQSMVETLVVLLDVPWGAIDVVDEKGGLREGIFAGEPPGGRQKMQAFILHRTCMVNAVLSQNRSVVVGNVPRFLREQGMAQVDTTFRTFIGVPITVSDTPVGCLYVCDKPGDAGFDKEDEILLLGLAQAASMAMSEARERAARSRAEQLLREQVQKYRQLVNDAGAIVYEADPQTLRRRFVNLEAERLLGYPAGAWVDEPEFWQRHIHQEDRESVERTIASAAAEGKDAMVEYRFTDSAGKVHWFQDSLHFAGTEGEDVGVLRGIMLDITEAKTARLQDEVFAQLYGELAAATTLREVAVAARAATEKLWQWDCFILSVRRASHVQFRPVMVIDTEAGAKREYGSPTDQLATVPTLREAIFSEGVLLNRESTANLHGLRPFGTQRISMSLIYAAIRVGTDVVGLVTVQSYTPQAFQETDKRLLQKLAHIIAPAIARCHADMIRATFAQLGRLLNSAHTPRQVAEIIVNAADDILGWDSCAVSLFVPEENLVFPLYHVDTIDGKRVPLKTQGALSPLAEQTIREGPQLILRSTPDFDTATLYPFGDKSRPSASLMFVPIRTQNGVSGVLSIQSYLANAYDERDLSILKDLADHCAGALARVRAQQTLHQPDDEDSRLLPA